MITLVSGSRRVNNNHGSEGHYLRDIKPGLKMKFVKSLAGFYQRHKPKFIERKHYLQGLKSRLGHVAASDHKEIFVGTVTMPEEFVRPIDDMYRQSNKNLAVGSGVDLERYGYVGGRA